MARKKFRISSALKDLLGRELITDKFVAVFELVKNASDAQASQVCIEFVASADGVDERIVIRDNGCGMNAKDIVEKWLFVGYSEKRGEGASADYRARLNAQRYLAGAKGVGRFSCDRLGRKLRMITRRYGEAYNTVEVNWGDFEKDSLKEFGKVDIEHSESQVSPSDAFEQGTVIEITSLRDEWTRQSLLTLKRHLVKLVNPLSLDDEEFSIEIRAEKELEEDNREGGDYRKVNGPVKNFLFEKLDLSTISIDVEISEDGKTISTVLCDKGKNVYSTEERNVDYKELHSIKVKLFQLDKNAKEAFTRMMSIRPVRFGSVFVYKNNFRIYPFGEPGDDSLLIDHRKQQGTRRYLGSRELIGRVVISGEQEDLHETTSRSGGIIQNDVYRKLLQFVAEVCLRRLEKYVIDALKWGDIGLDASYLKKLESTQKIASIIQSLVESGNLISLSYSQDFLENFNKAMQGSSERLPEQLVDIANEVEQKEVAKKLRAAASRMKDLVSARKAAEKRTALLLEEKKDIAQQLEQKNSQVLFLNQVADIQVEHILQCCHSIITYACTIDNWIQNYNDMMKSGDADDASVTQVMNSIEETNKKILSLSRMATKANFNASAPEIQKDIVQFFKEYIDTFITTLFKGRMECHCKGGDLHHFCKFSPLDMGIVIENLAFNSFKASSTNVVFEFSQMEDDKLCLVVCDNGRGVKNPPADSSVLFQRGYTTTDGSGLGLYQVKQYLSALSATIQFDSSYSNGFKLVIVFH